jgi:hypothetical protein
MRAQLARGARVRGEDQVERDGELGGGVRGELDQVAAAQALVLLPGVHDGAVVDGDDVHLVDPRLLKVAHDLGFLEARDLARGSGGREGARERHPKNFPLVEIARPGPREGGR